ncbi:IS110 family transposase [Candidatus Mesenet endosymbiont of Agriotes lineatus]|uniref:IS110 family transposase n=1 Tax=Candidatus Mesenet endosymbiont of Agriotes lineatus TaxID=3077948 RepID=UPI0030CC5EA7
MQTKAVLGVDISKQKFDACLLVGSKERHKVFHNNKEGFERLVAWCNNHGADLIHLCLEATGCYSEDLVNFMYDLGHNVSVINPAQIKAFGKSELLRNKTDKSDAAMIAKFCIANKPNLWRPVPTEVKYLKELYRCLQALKDDKLQQMNRLENKNMYSRCQQAISEVIATVDTQIDALEKEINEHINNHLHLKNMIKNIKTVKGIGHLTTIAVVSEMPSVDNFDNARQFTAFAGLNPGHYQSGSSVSKKVEYGK